MKHRLESIELLRFLLALSVVFYHYFYIGPLDNMIGGPSISLPYLVFSVHAFFVVSGFVIMFSAADRTFDEFIVARIARLGPSLLVCGTITFLAFWLSPFDTIHIRAAQFFRSIFVVPLAFGSGVDHSYWSLKYEVIFYACVTILIWRGLTPVRLLQLICLMLFSDIASFALDYAGVNLKWSPTNAYGAFFCIGMLFYLGRQHFEFRKLWPYWLATLAIASMDAFVDFNRVEVNALHQHSRALWEGPAIAAAITILIGLFLFGSRFAPPSRIFRILGAASYPLYLIHQDLGYWAIKIQEHALGLNVNTARAATIILMIGFSVAFSIALEPPLMRIYARWGNDVFRKINLRIISRMPKSSGTLGKPIDQTDSPGN